MPLEGSVTPNECAIEQMDAADGRGASDGRPQLIHVLGVHMTRSRARLLAGAGIVLLGVVAAYIYRQYRDAAQASDVIAKAFVEAMRHPRPAAAVKSEAWSQVRTGMTKQEVLALLGEAPRQMQGESSKLAAPKDVERREFWEYGYASAFGAPVPHDRAYVVYFDHDGRVSSFRKPIDGQASHEIEAKR